MKNNVTKMAYKKPTFDVVVIEMEQGIAAASATITPGGNGANNFAPEVDDWTENGTSSSNFDL